MNFSRRNFLQTGAAGLAATTFLPPTSLFAYAAGKNAKFKLSAPDWSLRKEAKLDAVALSKNIGFAGVQISIGHGARGETISKLPLSDPALQKQYLDEAKKLNFKITSLCLEIMHVNGLKSDPLGEKWLAESIPIAKAMGDAWAAFINGRPPGEGLGIEWPRYSTQRRSVMVFDTAPELQIDPESDERQLWDEYTLRTG